MQKEILQQHSSELWELGYVVDDLGVHSARKGGITFVSSGSTAAPNSVAVNNRAGLTLGGVRDVYMLYERDGDNYIGRLMSGLPALSSNFAAKNPDFYPVNAANEALFSGFTEEDKGELDCDVITFLKKLFGKSFVNIQGFFRVGLATIFCNKRALDDMIPDDTQLRCTAVFTDTEADKLIKYAHFQCEWQDSGILLNVTGVPPHVILMGQLRDLHTELKTIVPLVLDGVDKQLEARSITAGISEDQFKLMM